MFPVFCSEALRALALFVSQFHNWSLIRPLRKLPVFPVETALPPDTLRDRARFCSIRSSSVNEHFRLYSPVASLRFSFFLVTELVPPYD